MSLRRVNGALQDTPHTCTNCPHPLFFNPFLPTDGGGCPHQLCLPHGGFRRRAVKVVYVERGGRTESISWWLGWGAGQHTSFFCEEARTVCKRVSEKASRADQPILSCLRTHSKHTLSLPNSHSHSKVVYMAILDITKVFGAGKTSLGR